MKEWKEHFMSLLGGVEERVIMGIGRDRREEEEGVKEISRKEISDAIRKLKEGKAIGEDGIAREAWIYGGEVVEEWIWGWCNRVWKGEGWPESWKEGIVIPILKSGEGRKVENYRGITIMSASYKIYAGILAERLRTEVEEGGIIPQN